MPQDESGNGAIPPIIENDPVNPKKLDEWNTILKGYKSGKTVIEQRIKNNEQFWRMRQWRGFNGQDKTTKIPSTAWLFTAIQSKLADVMDAYPTANFLPRQKDDEEEAKRLSSIVPVILKQVDFENVYKRMAEYVLKNGVGVLMTTWDGSKYNGIGDISIEPVGIFNIFWETGITDIQKSSYVFKVECIDSELFYSMYPDAKGKISGGNVDIVKFATDDTDPIGNANKIAVVDVYYKRKANGREILHYARYADTYLIFSTENEPDKYPNGWYEHGKYPFTVIELYHNEESLYGTGMVDIGADTQLQIDQINEAVTENVLFAAKPRYFKQRGAEVDEKDLGDWTKSFVPVDSLDERYLREIEHKTIQGNYMSFLEMKQNELKYATSNQDVNNGTAPSGITAASAIAALQETSGKNSREINKTLYHAFRDVISLVVELIRQFYNLPRYFRIIPDVTKGAAEYIEYDNSRLQPIANEAIGGVDMGLRKPEFDIEISAEKASTYHKMEMNELALNFYKMGFFNPQMADQALACIQMMDFDRKEKIIEQIESNGTMEQRLAKYVQLVMAMAQKYGDAQAMQVVQMDLAQHPLASMPQAVGGQPVNLGEDADEPTHMERAREQARESTQPQT